jgi:hypothetical protein
MAETHATPKTEKREPARDTPPAPLPAVVHQDADPCARCGGAHGLAFRRMARPVEVGGAAFNFWAQCPASGEPLLIAVEAAASARPV